MAFYMDRTLLGAIQLNTHPAASSLKTIHLALQLLSEILKLDVVCTHLFAWHYFNGGSLPTTS